MLPVIALVGRPNVGKSTLFNRLTRTRDALVADIPGLTRDRKYGEGRIDDRRFIVIDTAGIVGDEEGVDALMAEQSMQAVIEADAVLFMVDARAGLIGVDEEIAVKLRALGKKIHLVVNKVDGINENVLTEFFALGLGDPFPIAAVHGRGVLSLMDEVLDGFDWPKPRDEYEVDGDEEGEGEVVHPDRPVKFAIIGRPNVGKSTMVNRMLGEERVVVFDMPGTTRDSIYIDMERGERKYTIIDTAGVRRKGKVHETIEKFSVIKTLQAIEDANVVIAVLDAREGVTDQDLSLLGFVLETGRALVLALNKWDGMDSDQKDNIRRHIEMKLDFVNFARMHFVSALHGTGIGDLFHSVDEAHRSATLKLSTTKLTNLLGRVQEVHQPPLVNGRRIKFRYAHAGGHNPPIIVVHGNQVSSTPEAYRRYMVNFFRKSFQLVGTPIRMEFKEGENPFEGKKNELSARQVTKRKRLVKHIRKTKRKDKK
ncbi:MAG: ribosome biogenesis GTPase Der [Gammaproteobacteria bacterium]|nr:ribosome biogenesis GTPase Der [Gammaproteobacteria bacterium]